MKNILQIRTHKDLIIKRKSFFPAFITHAVPIGYKTKIKGALLRSKRAPFTPQKGIFYNVKERLLIY